MEDHAITELRKVFPKITPRIGTAIWCVLTGGYPDGTYRNITLPTGDLVQGTWNYWNQVIHDAKGKKNEKTFKGNTTQTKIKSAERKLKKAGWKLATEGIKLDRDLELRDQLVEIMGRSEK